MYSSTHYDIIIGIHSQCLAIRRVEPLVLMCRLALWPGSSSSRREPSELAVNVDAEDRKTDGRTERVYIIEVVEGFFY